MIGGGLVMTSLGRPLWRRLLDVLPVCNLLLRLLPLAAGARLAGFKRASVSDVPSKYAAISPRMQASELVLNLPTDFCLLSLPAVWILSGLNAFLATPAPGNRIQ